MKYAGVKIMSLKVRVSFSARHGDCLVNDRKAGVRFLRGVSYDLTEFSHSRDLYSTSMKQSAIILHGMH